MADRIFADQFERVLADEAGVELLSPEPGATLPRRFRHNAPLVTQLMAVKMDAPQTRARRRAVPAEGIAAYGATAGAIVLGRRTPGMSWGA